MSFGLTGVTDRKGRDNAIREMLRRRAEELKKARDRLLEVLKRARETVQPEPAKKAQPTGHEFAEPRWRDKSAQSAELRRDLQARGSAPTLAAAEAEDKKDKMDGVAAAKEAVKVDQSDVREEKDKVRGTKGAIDGATKDAVDATFARADKLPHGAEVVSQSDDAIEIVRRDKQGNLMWREKAERDGDELKFERTEWRDGKATRSTLDSGPEKSGSRSESWTEAPSKDPSNPSTDELEEKWKDDPAIEIREESYERDGDALIAKQAAFDKDGRNETEATYSTQDGGDGIHDELSGEFDGDKTTDKVETKRISQERGKDEESSTQTTYSQGNVRATSVEQGGDDAPPKQWMLEKQNGDEYKAQTFVENAPKFSTITTRRADGDRVHEEVKSTGLDADGKDVKSNSTSDTRFDARGMIASKKVDSTDERGVRTLQNYTRDASQTGRGLEIAERLQTQRIEPGDPPKEFTGDHQIRTLQGAEGPKLLSSSNDTTSPDGEAQSVIDERGPRLTVNGKAVPVKENSEQLDKLSEGELDLAAHTTADSFGEVKKYAAIGTGALGLVSIAGGLPDRDYASKLSSSSQAKVNANVDGLHQRLSDRFGAERVDKAFSAQRLGAAGGRSVMGLAGLAAASSAFIDDAHQFNFNKAEVALDAGTAAVGGSQGVAAAKEASALKAGGSADEAADAAGKFGSFAKFGGLAIGVGLGGFDIYQGAKSGDKVKMAQGGVTIAGAVGTFAAIGAIGGLPGIAVGAGIGLLAFGINWGIGKLFGGDPEVAHKQI
jgi:hypothetical protein